MSAVADLDLPAASEELEPLAAADRIRWAADRFGTGLVLLGSMQKTASVLVDLWAELGLDNEILFVDTGFHFPETLRLRDRLVRRYGVNLVTLYPPQTPEQQEAAHGRKLHLFVDGQPECCRLRKEEPLIAHLRSSGHRVVANGLRRADGGRRRTLAPLQADPRFGGLALHPIYDWTDGQVADYLSSRDVPVHPLHAQSYPSIGCECCTTPVRPGEDDRAGRWRHLRSDDAQPAYCGINFGDGAGI